MISINESDKSDHRVSPTTKVLIKKLNKGKKPDSKFWRSEFSAEEKQPQRKEKVQGPSAIKQIMALLSGMLVGVIILFFYFRPDIARQNDIIVAPPFKETQRNPTPQGSNSSSKPQYSQPAEGRYNANQASRGYVNSSDRINASRGQSNQIASNTGKLPYHFEIEFHSGGKIYTDNADIKDDVVTYKNQRGLLVSINRDEIKNMKWVNAY